MVCGCGHECFCWTGRYAPTNEEVVLPVSKHRQRTRRASSTGRTSHIVTDQNSHSIFSPSKGLQPKPPHTAGKLVDSTNKVHDSKKHEEKALKPKGEEGFEYCSGGICSPVKLEKQGEGMSTKMKKKYVKVGEGRKPPLGHLMFDGQFEGGNIAEVRRLEDGSEYDIWLQHDTLNPRYSHLQCSNTISCTCR